MTADAFSPHMETVAKLLCGEVNKGLSSATELRFGAHGSLAVDLEKGTYFDHEAGQGGGVLGLIERCTGNANGAAVDWLKRECNVDLPDDRRPEPARAEAQKVVARYDYQDEAGDLLFQVVRFGPKKDFRQRRPDQSADGGWNWSVKGVRQTPYRLPELIEAISLDQTVFVVEGEKDVEALAKQGITATCNAGGAGKWPDGFAEHFAGADVVILPDNDDAGRNHAAVVGASLQGVARRVRTLDLPDLPPKGDVSDWMGRGGDGAALYALVETDAKGWAPAPPLSAFGAVHWSGLDHVVARRDWLVEDIMFCGDFCLQYGASQSGKSFLAVDMALSIARGEPFFGKATRKGGVLYQAGEGGLGLVSRLKAYRAHHQVKGDLPFVLLPKRVDLYANDADNGIDAFLAEIAAQKAWLSEPLALVVIDTFSTATPGANENASEDVSRALRNIQRIQEAAGAAVLVVHHKNAGGEKPRGHTSLYANADAALEVIRSEEQPSMRTLRVAKVKDGEDGEKIGFTLQPVEIGSYDDGKQITSCVVCPAQEGEHQAGTKREYLPKGQFKFLKTLEDAIIHRGGIIPPESERIPTNMRGVDWREFRALYAQINSQSMNDEAIRQALKRDGDALFNRGVINKHEHWIWVTDRGRQWL